MNTSEIRGEVEQTRWQLLQDSGIQKTELLRARQDMVNRIIQMGEKVQCCISWFSQSKHVHKGAVLPCFIYIVRKLVFWVPSLFLCAQTV